MSTDAVQVTDMLMGGFMTGLESIRARKEQRAQIALETSLSGQLNEWKAYAGKLEKVIDAQAVRIKAMQQDYEGLKEQFDGLNDVSKTISRSLIDKIGKLNASLQRQSANSYAIGKMRDRLVEELAELAGNHELIDPEKRLEMHKQDWQEFMESNTVKPMPMPPAFRKN